MFKECPQTFGGPPLHPCAPAAAECLPPKGSYVALHVRRGDKAAAIRKDRLEGCADRVDSGRAAL